MRRAMYLYPDVLDRVGSGRYAEDEWVAWGPDDYASRKTLSIFSKRISRITLGNICQVLKRREGDEEEHLLS